MCAVIKISPCMLDESRAFHFEEPSTTGGTSGHPLDEPHPQPQRPPTEEKRKEKKKKERREARVGRRLVWCFDCHSCRSEEVDYELCDSWC